MRKGTGWRRDVSKKLCPDPIYKDLKSLIDKLAYTRPSLEKPTRRTYKTISDEYLYLTGDHLLKDLNEEEYNELPVAQKQFLYLLEYLDTNYWTRKTVRKRIYRLKDKYRNYLYDRRAPIYINSYYIDIDDMDVFGDNNSKVTKLRNYIEKHNLWPKIRKAIGSSYKYKDPWDRYKKEVEDKLSKKQMRDEIEEYMYERELLKRIPKNLLDLFDF